MNRAIGVSCALLVTACGGGAAPATREQIANFVGNWEGTFNDAVCGTQSSSGQGGIGLSPGTDADLEYTTIDGCLIKFRVSGTTATLINHPTCRFTQPNGANGTTVTFYDYRLTRTAQVLTIDADGTETNGGGSCDFTSRGTLCAAPSPTGCSACAKFTSPPAAVALELVSGADQTAVAGSALSAPINLRVTDAKGLPVAGAPVALFVEEGGGRVVREVTTGADGTASFAWTLGTTALSPQQLVAEACGPAPIRVHATAVAGPAVTFSVESTYGDVLLGDHAQLIATPRDAYGNIATLPGAPVWSSDDPSVLTVSTDGVASGVAFGTTTVRVAAGQVQGSRSYAVDGIFSGSGAATLDGALSPGEWDAAGSVPLTVNSPNGGTTPGRLYVMNDATNLYLALSVARPGTDSENDLRFIFDRYGYGRITAGDDEILLDANGFHDVSLCDGVGVCLTNDTSIDGAAVFHNDGTNSVFEFRHPLRSGDSADIAVGPGDRLGVLASVYLIASSGGVAGTGYPSASGFLKVQIH